MSATLHSLLDRLDDSIQLASDLEQPDNCIALHELYNDFESAVFKKKTENLDRILLHAIDLVEKAQSQMHQDITLGKVFTEISQELTEIDASWSDLNKALQWHLKQVLKGRAELLIA